MGVDFSIQEEQFSVKNTNNYDLFIITGMDRFSFLVGDNQSNLLALKSYVLDANNDLTDAIKEVCLTEEMLKLPYRSVKIGLVNNGNCLGLKVNRCLFSLKKKLERTVATKPL